MRFRRLALLRMGLCALILVLAETRARTQDFMAFDVAVILEKSIWSNLVAAILPSAKFDLTRATISLVDAVLCESAADKTRLLLAFKEKDAQAYIVVTESDCDKSAAALAKEKMQPFYDGFVYVSAASKDGRLQVVATEAAARDGASLTPGVIEDIRAYAVTLDGQSLNVGEGALSNRVDLSGNFVDGGLVVKGRHPAMNHALKDTDILAGFIASTQPGNTQVLISHGAISKVVEIYLQGKEFPINGTDAKFKIVSYSGDVDRVTIQATIDNAGLTFSRSATWSGRDLRLSSYSVKSIKDCSSGSAFQKAICNVAREAETKAAEALAAIAWQKYQSTALVPLTRNDKIKFQLYSRPAYFAGQTVSASSTAEKLTITLDSYVGVDR